ncbi:MAG: ferritin-like domain-containing protein [Nitrospinota bacterium]
MNLPVREPMDDTVTRLAPATAEEPEICAGLKEAYLEEKLLSQQLSALASWEEPGWKPALAREVKGLADRDTAHVRTVAEALKGLGGTPPERPETGHPVGPKPMDVRSVLLKAMEAKKDLEIRYVRAASLADVEGRRTMTARLEDLAEEEVAGRRTLLTILSRFPAFRAED